MRSLLVFACLLAAASCLPRRQVNPCYGACPMFIITFCGSDGKTYTSNECFEKSRMCSQGLLGYSRFHTLHYGACTGKELTGMKSTEAGVPKSTTEAGVPISTTEPLLFS